MSKRLLHRAALGLLASLALALACAGVATARGGGKKAENPQPPVETAAGSLRQLPGRLGCLATGRAAKHACARARGVKGPGPFMGSRAIAVSPDGKNVYVAAGRGDAVATFDRDPGTGTLTQPAGKAGCVAARGAEGCARAHGLIGPNSIAVSPDGRDVYATARGSAAVLTFRRNRRTGALRQLPAAAGCVAGLPLPGCALGRALGGADVVVVSPDGKNVYVGSFLAGAVASFSRARGSGALTQLGGTAGCLAAGGAEGCAAGIGLGGVEGLAMSRGGGTVYAAAATSSVLSVLSRDRSSGALDQRGCVATAPIAGCALGYELGGVNAVTVAPRGGDVYATALSSNSLTSFHLTKGGGIAQPPGPEVGGEPTPAGTPSTDGCVVFLRAPGCAFGLAMKSPEGLAVSPDGTSVYLAAFASGALDVLDRDPKTGFVAQKPGTRGCVAARLPGCGRGRALGGVSSVAVSPDGRNVYATAYAANAVDVFGRIDNSRRRSR